MQQALEAPELKARTMPSSEFLLGHSLSAFDAEGNLQNEKKVEELEAIFADFLVYISIVEQLPNARVVHKETAKKFIWDEI